MSALSYELQQLLGSRWPHLTISAACAELAQLLIQAGFIDPLFAPNGRTANAKQLASLLTQVANGARWPFGDDALGSFRAATLRCLDDHISQHLSRCIALDAAVAMLAQDAPGVLFTFALNAACPLCGVSLFAFGDEHGVKPRQ